MLYKYIILFVFILSFVPSFAQPEMDKLQKQIKEDRISVEKHLEESKKLTASVDSSMNEYTKAMKESQRRRDSITMTNNLNYFLAEQKIRKQKEQKNWLITRGLFSVALVLAMVGAARRKRRAKAKKLLEETNKS